jgi:hypothetical protein
LIEQAVASQYGNQYDFLNETLDFIRFTRLTVESVDLPSRHTGTTSPTPDTKRL